MRLPPTATPTEDEAQQPFRDELASVRSELQDTALLIERLQERISRLESATQLRPPSLNNPVHPTSHLLQHKRQRPRRTPCPSALPRLLRYLPQPARARRLRGMMEETR